MKPLHEYLNVERNEAVEEIVTPRGKVKRQGRPAHVRVWNSFMPIVCVNPSDLRTMAKRLTDAAKWLESQQPSDNSERLFDLETA